MARRAFLGLGAMAGVTALSACAGAGLSSSPSSARSTKTRPATRTTPTAEARGPQTFFGCPPPGRVYYGASLPDSRSLLAWEAFLGTPLALNRSYFTAGPGVTEELVGRCRDDLAHDRLPHVSIKPPGTWRDVATGVQNSWLNDLCLALGTLRGPVFLTLHHEPENDAGGPGMLPADFVAMQRRAIAVAADLAPHVTVVPVLQHWTFDPVRTDIDPRVWIVSEAAVFGVDIYNPWSADNGKEWRTFGSLVGEVAQWAGDTPIAVGEYGCRDDPSNPGLASQWLRDAAAYARQTNVVSMSYFNSDVNAPDGSLELHGETEQTFAALLASPWVARPT